MSKQTTQPTRKPTFLEALTHQPKEEAKEDFESHFEMICDVVEKEKNGLSLSELRKLLEKFSEEITEVQFEVLLAIVKENVEYDSNIASGLVKFRPDLLNAYEIRFPKSKLLWKERAQSRSASPPPKMGSIAEASEEDEFETPTSRSGTGRKLPVIQLAKKILPFCLDCSQGRACDKKDSSLNHTMATLQCKYEEEGGSCTIGKCTYLHKRSKES